MKLTLRLILFLTAAISLVTFIVVRYQVRQEEQALRADLRWRAEILAESLQSTIEPLLNRGLGQLQPVVERFGNRGPLAGVAIYDRLGQVLAASSSIRERFNFTPPRSLLTETKPAGTAAGRFLHLAGKQVHLYVLPLRAEGGNGHYLAIFHDASYIGAQTARMWRNALWFVLAQVVLAALLTLLVVRWSIASLIARTAGWIRDLRTGRFSPRHDLPEEGLFRPLSQEVASLVGSLAEARAVAEEEARLRDTAESRWTAERLRVSMQSKLQGNRVFVVSNREPYEHVYQGKSIEAVVPASGLVTALEPILQACQGTWIAYASGEADHEVVDPQGRLVVPPEQPQYTLRRLWLSQQEVDGYYFGFANEGLWPLCHIVHTRPIFRSADWAEYQRVNEKFAEAIFEETEGIPEPIVLIQDYHFALLPKLVKLKRPNARVAIFWHIPWPNPEAFGICPWQRELLDGLLGADLVSFHIQSHCNNFLETVDRVLESQIDWEGFAVKRQGQFTMVRAHPISVAFGETGRLPERASRSAFEKAPFLKAAGIETALLGFGVDRLDYTKGIVERFRGIERFLETNPFYREQFTFVQFGAPSRTNIKRYQDFMSEVVSECDRINKRFESKKWKPILLFLKHHSQKEIEPFYKAADLCLVTSLHDGMNLVAKEFVAARDDEDGVLILSRFTGASRELRDALIVNPYDVEQLAESIRCALEMPTPERKARMRNMRRTVRENNIYRWAADLISALAELRLDQAEPVRRIS
ncbi:MAG: trehalose-6-phosphate synthase [Acidobacteria bacterium]|nr:trehalose-6-phosphate synthase [Acidobacteriota bacterium]